MPGQRGSHRGAPSNYILDYELTGGYTLDTEAKADKPVRRLRFYGAGDYATYWQIRLAREVVESLDPATPPDELNGILELYNARLFIEGGFIPRECTEVERESLVAAVKPIKRIVAQWFSSLDEANLLDSLSGVDWQYDEHLLDLLAIFGLFGRFTASAMLEALDSANIRLKDLLTSKRLVQNYDETMRERILSDPDGAEIVIRHHFVEKKTNGTVLPESFTVADGRALMASYIESVDANANCLKLIADAPINAETGIDAKLAVKARRRYDAIVEEFFRGNSGVMTGCKVAISSTQAEPIEAHLNDLVLEYSLSQSWLDSTLDFASVLNNFQFVFDFAGQDGLLTLPAFDGEIRGLERIMGLSGASEYRTGGVFYAKNVSTLLQTATYVRYLSLQEIDLEEVFRWYFEEHLLVEYGIAGFAFSPSSRTANYLERCRNLFAEMESVATQFGLFVEDGEVDHEVVAAGADAVRYRSIPSSLKGKYVYATGHEEIRIILHLLFSDQSHLTYIDDDLHADNAVDLLRNNEVSYEALHEYQRNLVDKLIDAGIVEVLGTRIALKDPALFRVLKSLNDFEAVSYHHLNDGSRAHVDTMIEAGWLARRSSLLAVREAEYFNYYLNSVGFSNGPKLRNKYQHGAQPRGDGEVQHEETYYIAVRLMVALTIKINDELWLLDATSKALEEEGA